MTVGSGTTLTLLSCSRCEGRTWLADGELISMDEVLKLTSGDPDFAVAASPRKQRRRAGGAVRSAR
jgi:hypothetical protein